MIERKEDIRLAQTLASCPFPDHSFIKKQLLMQAWQLFFYERTLLLSLKLLAEFESATSSLPMTRSYRLSYSSIGHLR